MAGGLRGRVSYLAPLGRANLCWAVAKLQATEKPQSVKACCPCAAICLDREVPLLRYTVQVREEWLLRERGSRWA